MNPSVFFSSIILKHAKWWLLLVTVFTQSIVHSQVTGGRFAFPFLNIPNGGHMTAMGGIVPASYDKDVTLMRQNPALLQSNVHNHLYAGYNVYMADIGITNLSYAFHVPKVNTNFGFSIQNVSYGNFTQTDVYGNHLGQVKANDLAINLHASKIYKEKWHYGATLKFASSNLAGTTSFSTLVDIGIAYQDKENLLSIGAVVKNAGITLKKYNPNLPSEPLPFDVQLGIMKGFKNIPLRIYGSVHHMYEWDIRYNDPANISIDIFGNPTEDINDPKFADKLFRHINVGAELTIAKRLTATVGYSHLRRQELGFKQSKGMAGFSMGAQINLTRLIVQYGVSNYGNGIAYHDFGLIMPLGKIIKVKPAFNQKVGWDKIYE